MKSQLSDRQADLSALFDGECDIDASRRIARAATEDHQLNEVWRIYALIGDQLRGDRPVARDMTADVMARLREEPVVLAPRPLAPRRQHPFLALAASLAGVAVVGWLAMAEAPEHAPVGGGYAAVSPAPTFVQAAAVPVARPPAENSGTRGDMSEYLLAHHTQASSFRLGDSTEHVRTVSVVAGAPRP